MTKIWVELEEWDCGDGCCSDSWFNVCTDDSTHEGRIHERFYSIEDAVKFLNKEYPHCEVDADKCSTY